MLKHQLLHPKLNEVLGQAGHTSTVLIADGNYPAATAMGPRAELVSLNLAPGVVTCTQVLDALASAIPIEAARTMAPESSGPYSMPGDPPIWDEFRRVLTQRGVRIDLQPIERFAFYKLVSSPEHVLTVQTADGRLYANLLLTIGVRRE